MKRIYTFTIEKEIESEKLETESSKEGEDQSKAKKKEEKEKTPSKETHTFFISKPTRLLLDELDKYRSIKVNEGIKDGLLPAALLAKRFSDDEGVLSKFEQDQYIKLHNELFSLRNDIEKLQVKEEKKRSEKEKQHISELVRRTIDIRTQLQDFEIKRADLYKDTAESYAQNKSIIWLTLHTAYEEVENKEQSYFGEGDFNAKIIQYYNLLDAEDSFINTVIERFIYFITLWYRGAVENEDDFKNAEKLFVEQRSTIT